MEIFVAACMKIKTINVSIIIIRTGTNYKTEISGNG